MGFATDSDELIFFKDEEDPIDADVIILDEASMVDIILFVETLSWWSELLDVFLQPHDEVTSVVMTKNENKILQFIPDFYLSLVNILQI